MAALFSRPSKPTVYPSITDDTAAVKEAARREAERLRKRKGLASTIMTGPQGVTEGANVLKSTLG